MSIIRPRIGGGGSVGGLLLKTLNCVVRMSVKADRRWKGQLVLSFPPYCFL